MNETYFTCLVEPERQIPTKNHATSIWQMMARKKARKKFVWRVVDRDTERLASQQSCCRILPAPMPGAVGLLQSWDMVIHPSSKVPLIEYLVSVQLIPILDPCGFRSASHLAEHLQNARSQYIPHVQLDTIT